jgi:hypothetical protein
MDEFEAPLSSDRLLQLALFNNKGQIHWCLGQRNNTLRCLRGLRTSLAFFHAYSEEFEELIVKFRLNFVLLHASPMHAPQA